MNKSLYIIAEAAQGYEGSVDIAKLLVRGAVAAKADAIKFQVVFAKDLCEPGYEYYDLFKQLEMSLDEWKSIRLLAQENSIDFVVDVFGERAFELAKELNVDGIKLHSTTFFDHRLVRQVLALNKKTFISIGGITPEEIDQFVEMFRSFCCMLDNAKLTGDERDRILHRAKVMDEIVQFSNRNIK